MGTISSLARNLQKLGGGMPCHPLPLGYKPGADTASNGFLVAEMLREAHVMAARIGKALPADYPIEMKADVLRELEGMTRSSPRRGALARHENIIVSSRRARQPASRFAILQYDD